MSIVCGTYPSSWYGVISPAASDRRSCKTPAELEKTERHLGDSIVNVLPCAFIVATASYVPFPGADAHAHLPLKRFSVASVGGLEGGASEMAPGFWPCCAPAMGGANASNPTDRAAATIVHGSRTRENDIRIPFEIAASELRRR
jgi:hypothetical protein